MTIRYYRLESGQFLFTGDPERPHYFFDMQHKQGGDPEDLARQFENAAAQVRDIIQKMQP